jgi:formyltetrahydrofolate deformylase
VVKPLAGRRPAAWAEYGSIGPDTARLLVTCPDRPGIIAAISRFLYELDANIITSDQYSSDAEHGRFFLRMTFRRPGVDAMREELERAFAAEVGSRFAMKWRISYGTDRPRIALMASRHDHCLLDLLWRWQRGELRGELTQVVSNHEDLREAVEVFDLPYHYVPVDSKDKAAAEKAALERLVGSDLVIFARYMQIVSGDFLNRLGCPVINIHHSFLPAFAGADPYQRARERGVKLIGATAHYVTVELDRGPIIEQDVLRVTHRYTPADLERVGRDVERVVLARAVRSHLDDRVLVDGSRAIVF